MLRRPDDDPAQTIPGRDRLSRFIPKRLIRNNFVHNVMALYGVQACTYALPLLTFPYLARVLGPSGWGVVVFAQAIGVVIQTLVEYGFDISAMRETSRHREDPKRLSGLISGVLGAKSLLAVVGIAGAVLSRRFTHHIAPSPALFWASVIWGVCQGINMLWFFQGLERMQLASTLEIGGKVLATASIFLLVHHPDDGWKVMAAQCVGCVVSHGVTVILAYREVGFQWPTFSSVWESLRLGGSMFVFRTVQGLFGSVNRLVLGYFAPVAALGEYAGAERITRVFQQGMWPVNQALYPKLTQQTQKDPARAIRIVRLSVVFLGALGIVLGLAIYFGAPLLVHFVLGSAFKDSVPILRVFALWIPLVAISTVIIFQILLPNQLDNQFNIVNLTTALIGIAAAFALAPEWKAVGIAWATVISQLYTVVAFCYIVWRAGLNPFSARSARKPVLVAALAGAGKPNHGSEDMDRAV
ncbi:MAG TPA: oligosaccharide flippase family protein [Acidobacteriaceae bacterium]|nr:oligosaccharide flippase family protein [Acidobacteriaceae bacterium]